MGLAASGTISLGGSTAGRSVNLELGKSASAKISLNDTAVRSLAKKSSGVISLHDLHGKSNIPVGTNYVLTFAKTTGGDYPAAAQPGGVGNISPAWRMTNGGIPTKANVFSYHPTTGEFSLMLIGSAAYSRSMLHNHIYCNGSRVHNADMAYGAVHQWGDWWVSWTLQNNVPVGFRFVIGQVATLIFYQ